jgi:hypothetical protein
VRWRESNVLALSQTRQSAVAFGDAFVDAGLRIETASFGPKRDCSRRIDGIAFEDGQSANGVCQVQRRGLRIRAVQIEGLIIARLGQSRMSGRSVDISHVPNRMGQSKIVAFSAPLRASLRASLRTIDRDRLFIMLQRRVRMIKIPFDLAEVGQRTGQFGSRARFAAQIDRLDEIAFRVVMPALSPCLPRIFQQFFPMLGHRGNKITTAALTCGGGV